MGIFERIRQASPWVLTTFAVVFVGFMVLGDMDFSSLQSTGNSAQNRMVAEIGERGVSYLEYENNVRNEITAQRQQYAAQGKEDQFNENAIRRAVYSNMVDSKILEIKSEKMGLNITDKVVGDYMIAYPPQTFVQSFSDSTGFRRDVYLRYITNPEGFANDMVANNPNATPGQAQEITTDIRERLRQISGYLEKQIYQNSVQVAMQEAGSIVSNEYLKQKYIADNSFADFEMIYLKTSDVKDEEIEIKEDELRKFYQKYSESYKQEAQRRIKYASFRLSPSQQDSINAKRKLQKIANLFSKATSKQDVQKLFKDASYEFGGETSELVPFSELDRFARSYLKNAVEGEIVGPASTLESTNYYRVAKIDSGDVTDIKASHILVNFNNNKDSAYKEAMKIYQRAIRGEDFSSLAIDLSQDKGSAPQGGDLGYFGKGKMVEEFETAAFAANIGDITKPVESQFGYHIINVVDKVNKKYQVETIAIKPTVGSNTRKQAQLKAKQLSDEALNGGDFEAIAEKFGAVVGESAPFFDSQPILGSGYITSFAFKNEKGQITKPIELDNFGVTVVQVSEVIPEGIPNFENVKENVEYLYKNKLKKDLLKAKAQKLYEAITSAGSDMQTVSADYEVRVISNNKNNGMIAGVQGRENVVTSAVYSQDIGSVSKPIRGNTGYFIVKTNSKNVVSDDLVNKNLAEYIKAEIQKEKRGGFYGWFQQVKNDVDVIDKRSDIYTSY
ncbi:peptidylprolyl isomerase [Candidatus Kapabacteria bacterium]|nr:peptidylprolyl isomerase [Candidatus Kapabacteria bacterium]